MVTANGSEKRRARSDDEKQQRRQRLIEVARQLYEQNGFDYEAVTMAGVAEQAGLAKGTVFLYFKTKEELFLALHEQLLEDWFDELDRRLMAATGSLSVEETVQLVCETLDGRAALTGLLAILHITLEKNTDFETALAFKKMLYRRFSRTGPLFEAHLPFLQPGQGSEMFLQVDALIIGFHHLAHPGPIVRQALAEPGMELFQVDFKQAFTRSLTALLYGLEKQGTKN